METIMTLKEYLNGKDPIRKPIVRVQEREIKRGVHNRITGYTSIWIKGIFNEYALKESTGWVYTIDSDGNPKSLSVFEVIFNSREKSLNLPL